MDICHNLYNNFDQIAGEAHRAASRLALGGTSGSHDYIRSEEEGFAPRSWIPINWTAGWRAEDTARFWLCVKSFDLDPRIYGTRSPFPYHDSLGLDSERYGCSPRIIVKKEPSSGSVLCTALIGRYSISSRRLCDQIDYIVAAAAHEWIKRSPDNILSGALVFAPSEAPHHLVIQDICSLLVPLSKASNWWTSSFFENTSTPTFTRYLLSHDPTGRKAEIRKSLLHYLRANRRNAAERPGIAQYFEANRRTAIQDYIKERREAHGLKEKGPIHSVLTVLGRTLLLDREFDIWTQGAIKQS